MTCTIIVGGKIAVDKIPNTRVQSYVSLYLDHMRAGRMTADKIILKYNKKRYVVKESLGLVEIMKSFERAPVLESIKPPSVVKILEIPKDLKTLPIPNKKYCEGGQYGITRSRKHKALAVAFVQVNSKEPYVLCLCLDCADRHRHNNGQQYTLGFFQQLNKPISYAELENLAELKF